jgi:hypothetical protein
VLAIEREQPVIADRAGMGVTLEMPEDGGGRLDRYIGAAVNLRPLRYR